MITDPVSMFVCFGYESRALVVQLVVRKCCLVAGVNLENKIKKHILCTCKWENRWCIGYLARLPQEGQQPLLVRRRWENHIICKRSGQILALPGNQTRKLKIATRTETIG